MNIYDIYGYGSDCGKDWWLEKIHELESEISTLDINDPKRIILKKEAMDLWVRYEEPNFYE